MNRQWLPFATIAVLLLTGADTATAQVYKWTDASGQVHYSQKKPDDALQAQTLDITSPPPAAPATADSAAEIARINALSEQMARERQAAEKTRQEQAIRDLEQTNQQLKNDLLNQQLQQRQQQEKDDSDHVILDYPLSYSYPYPYPRPHPPYPPHPWPCEPWLVCRQPPSPAPPPPVPAPPPLVPQVKPSPPFHPKPVGVAPTPEGFFRSR